MRTAKENAIHEVCGSCEGDGFCAECEATGECSCVLRDGEVDPTCAVCSGEGSCISCADGSCPECDGLGTVED